MNEIKRLTNADLAEIKKRAEATSFSSAYVKGDPWKGYEVKNENNGVVIAETSTKVDAEFIVRSRQDVPALLAEVERLRKALEGVVYAQYEIGAGFGTTKTLEIAKEAIRND